jgi:Family of unknown function (DUF6527)
MKPEIILQHEFVENIPEQLADRTLYISIPFTTVAHKCLCGCGTEVITPLSPTDWRVTFDGETISLHPSIGNWSFPCRSHYWIIRSRVKWSGMWTQEEIQAGRAEDRAAKQRYFGQEVVGDQPRETEPKGAKSPEGRPNRKKKFWRKKPKKSSS